MIFNFSLNGKEYSMDLSPESRVAVTRHLLKLYKEYCVANPTENISFEEYLALVERSPHPENEPPQDDDDDDEGTIEDDLIAYGAQQESLRRKDLLVEGLIELIRRIK